MNKEEELRILGKLSSISSVLSSAKDQADKVRGKLDGFKDEEVCYKEPDNVTDWLNTVLNQSKSVYAKLNHIDDLL